MLDRDIDFHITPKTSWEWLARQPSLRSGTVLHAVAADVLLNAQEVVPGVNWEDFVNQLGFIANGSSCMRFSVLVNSGLTITIASMAIRGRWNLADPETVALSVYSMSALARRNIRLLDFQDTINERLSCYAAQCLPGGQDELTALVRILQTPKTQSGRRQSAVDLVNAGEYTQVGLALKPIRHKPIIY